MQPATKEVLIITGLCVVAFAPALHYLFLGTNQRQPMYPFVELRQGGQRIYLRADRVIALEPAPGARSCTVSVDAPGARFIVDELPSEACQAILDALEQGPEPVSEDRPIPAAPGSDSDVPPVRPPTRPPVTLQAEPPVTPPTRPPATRG